MHTLSNENASNEQPNETANNTPEYRTIPSAPPPGLAYAFEAHVDIARPFEVGVTPRGHRRIIPITADVLAGPGLDGEGISGSVLTGADWQIIHSDTLLELEASDAI